MNKLYSLIVMIVLVSFLGFVVENTWNFFAKGYIDNRNMTLPFLLGYGLFVVAYYIVIGTVDDFGIHILPYLAENNELRRFCYYALAFIIVSIGEIILGFVTEKFFGFYYWNYENLPLHITRYTSVPTSMAFALIITLFMEHCFKPLLNWIETTSSEFLYYFSVVMFLLLIIDFIRSFNTMHIKQKPNLKWKIEFKSVFQRYWHFRYSKNKGVSKRV